MNLINVKKGIRLQFINYEYDHFMEVFLRKDRQEPNENGYRILLNGKLVASFETFPPFSSKCKALINEWDLEEY
jgi:hypothetical protein